MHINLRVFFSFTHPKIQQLSFLHLSQHEPTNTAPTALRQQTDRSTVNLNRLRLSTYAPRHREHQSRRFIGVFVFLFLLFCLIKHFYRWHLLFCCFFLFGSASNL